MNFKCFLGDISKNVAPSCDHAIIRYVKILLILHFDQGHAYSFDLSTCSISCVQEKKQNKIKSCLWHLEYLVLINALKTYLYNLVATFFKSFGYAIFVFI